MYVGIVITIREAVYETRRAAKMFSTSDNHPNNIENTPAAALPKFMANLSPC